MSEFHPSNFNTTARPNFSLLSCCKSEIVRLFENLVDVLYIWMNPFVNQSIFNANGFLWKSTRRLRWSSFRIGRGNQYEHWTMKTPAVKNSSKIFWTFCGFLTIFDDSSSKICIFIFLNFFGSSKKLELIVAKIIFSCKKLNVRQA